MPGKKGKSVKPSRTVEKEYFRSINEINLEQEQIIKKRTFGGSAPTAMSAVERSFDEFLSDKTLGVTEAITGVSAINANQFNQFTKKTSSVLGVDITGFLAQQPVNDFLKTSITKNVNLIRGITEQTKNGILNKLEESFLKGEFNQQELTQVLEGRFKVSSSKAKLIARDQTSKITGDLNQIRNQQIGVNEYIWSTVGDERVRDTHAANDGKTFNWNSPPPETGHPGQDINCFPGYSKINNTTFCDVFYRRWYTGELTEIVFDDGVVLSATAKHPILTDSGFKPIKLINSNDNIIRTLDESFLTVELDSKGMKPTFEQIFSALNRFGFETTVAIKTFGKFHGDGSDGDIDVIKLNGFLMDKVNASIIEKINKLKFTRADKVLVFDAFSCFGQGDFSCVTFRSSFLELMSRLDLSPSLFFRHFSPLQCFGLALGSWFDPVLKQVAPDNISGNHKMFSDCVFAFAVLVNGSHLYSDFVESFLGNHFGSFNVKLLDRSKCDRVAYSKNDSSLGNTHSVTYKVDKIIDKRIVVFSGHVYNLQTVSGDYNTGATIVSNCRCTAIPIIPESLLAITAA